MKKIGVYGNCQTGIIRYLLTNSSYIKQNCEIIPIKQVQNIVQEDIDKLLDIFPQLDIVIYQHNKGKDLKKKSTKYLLETTRNDCIKISIPSCYFEGYHPELIKVVIDGKALENPLFGQLHDAHILKLFLENPHHSKWSREADIFYNKDLYNTDFLNKVYQYTIEQLTSRENENNCDIKISNFIASNFKSKQLFNDHAHPTIHIYSYIIESIFSSLGVDCDIDWNQIDWSANIKYPIYLSTQHYLGLDFDGDAKYKFNGVEIERAVFFEQMLSYYRSLNYDKLLDAVKKNPRYEAIKNLSVYSSFIFNKNKSNISLVKDNQGYRIEANNQPSVYLKDEKGNITLERFPWIDRFLAAKQIEEGYEVLFQFKNGNFAKWVIDILGVRQKYQSLENKSMTDIQNEFEIDLDKSCITINLVGKGDSYLEKGQHELAVSNYQQATQFSPQAWIYSKLGNALEQNNQVDTAIEAYQRSIELNPNLLIYYANLANLLKRQGRIEEAVRLFQSFKEGKIYSKIWELLNQNNLENLSEETSHLPKELNQNQAHLYFQQTSEYKIVKLESINQEDRFYIEKAGLSLKHLKLNQKLVTQDGIFENTIKIGKLQNIVQLALKEGYIYAVCPRTGKTVRSNHSLPYYSTGLIFYRFVADEVFYLLCGSQLQKLFLYFPNLDLIIPLISKYEGKEYLPDENIVTNFKVFLTVNWSKVISYTVNSFGKKNKTVLAFQGGRSIGHQAANFLSPIHQLIRDSHFNQVSQFNLLYNPSIPESYYGEIEELFPEIIYSKIKTVKLILANDLKLLNETLEKNLFVFNINFNRRDLQISHGLANRIKKGLLKKCSSSFLVEVEQAKERCFPLLWIGFRTHKRTWVSKVDGIANIIKNLSNSFPNLGVVFDGFTRTDIKNQLFVSSMEEGIIAQDNKIVNQIQSLLPQEIPVYNLVGSPMHEVIMWAYAIDFYMVPVGSGITKVMLPNKPGVVHTSTLYDQIESPRALFKQMREHYVLPLLIPKEYVHRVTKPKEGEHKNYFNYDFDYDFDWRIAYEELLKIASSIKRDE